MTTSADSERQTEAPALAAWKSNARGGAPPREWQQIRAAAALG